ncbi:MAG: hypothetical protein K8F24_05320, partial [Bacteroidales bacterium]|nr:hypothetical protein [Bacteroidales bacterium]
ILIVFDSIFLIWILVFGLSPILSIFIIHFISKKHEFYEWDKGERQKKTSFLSTLTFMVFLFTYLSAFTLTTCIFDLYNTDFSNILTFDKVVYILRFSYGILFFFNAIFTVQLHNRFYSSDLTLSKYVAKKPNNWEWERTPEDDINNFLTGRW